METRHTPQNIILKVEDLKKYFPIRRGFFQNIRGWIKAVDGVSFEIERGKTLGLVGESGCGKTTVAWLILKLLKMDEGRIIFRDTEISELSEKEMKPYRQEMQMVFQDPYGSLNPRMTVGQSIEEGLSILGIKSRKKRKEHLKKLLEMVGMSTNSSDRYPHEFSGGQRQRIGIARALSVEPSLVICDEPISALDVSIQAQIINLLKDLQDQLELSYLFISHDLNVIGYLCTTISVMYKGLIVESASAEALFSHPYHPYTISLLSAIPDPESSVKKEVKLPARDFSDTLIPPDGCNYQGRCPMDEPRCGQEDLIFTEVEKDHFVRCWKVPKNNV
ncbi:MAG: ABC transporter ATP-binding protein [Desulfobacterales bacterium]|nr:MAG: ABC transporter ATP-binding protein [Desulfobacterales bacterium]UCD89788.1 MAG: ABC transporter ATP-binding protein [Desulfobacterales bacterium]